MLMKKMKAYMAALEEEKKHFYFNIIIQINPALKYGKMFYILISFLNITFFLCQAYQALLFSSLSSSSTINPIHCIM